VEAVVEASVQGSAAVSAVGWPEQAVPTADDSSVLAHAALEAAVAAFQDLRWTEDRLGILA